MLKRSACSKEKNFIL